MPAIGRTTLEQPVRRMFTEQLFYLWLLVFVALCSFVSIHHILYHLAISVLGYWLSRIIYVEWKWRRFFKELPKPKPHWLLGHIGLVTPDTLILKLQEFLDQCGPIIGVWMPRGYMPIVATADADAFRTVMSTNNTPKGMIMRFFERGLSILDPVGAGWLGTGLLTSNGDLWKSRRDMITPTFHFQILQNYMSIFRSRTKIMVSRFQKQAETNSQSFDVFPLCTDCTLDIIGACAFGLDLGCQTEPEPSHYVSAIRQITELVWTRIFHPLHQSPLLFALSSEGFKWRRLIKTVHQLPERLIRERRKFIEEHGEEIGEKRRLDFLDMLLTVTDENGEGLSELAIRNEVDTFLFEGHDTTAAALSWTIYCLASNPEYQARARAEVDMTLNPNHDEPTYEEARNGFEFLEACIKESLRLFPSVPFITRNNESEIKLCGYNIPAGTEIVLLIYAIQRSARYWSNPNQFNPDRFATEGIKHPFSYTPFSAGHRSCVGQVFAMLEEKTILSMLLYHFEFELDHSKPIDPETYIILRPRHGVYVKIKPRHH
jgi:cytochrome P450 family 4 subfamily V